MMKAPGCTVDERERGFTLVELIVAMAVFSMVFVVVIGGFINILHLRDQAVAMNTVQDNARIAMDQINQAIRDSGGAKAPVISGAGATGTTLCLPGTSGPDQYFWVVGGALQRADGCPPAALANVRQLTSGSGVMVTNFEPVMVAAPGMEGAKPEVQVTLTVASSTAIVGVGGVSCGSSVAQRSFCSVVTLTSGGTPR